MNRTSISVNELIHLEINGIVDDVTKDKITKTDDELKLLSDETVLFYANINIIESISAVREHLDKIGNLSRTDLLKLFYNSRYRVKNPYITIGELWVWGYITHICVDRGVIVQNGTIHYYLAFYRHLEKFPELAVCGLRHGGTRYAKNSKRFAEFYRDSRFAMFLK